MNHKSYYYEIPNKEEIKNDLIKPLHLYAMKISPKPKQIFENLYRQECYSEYLINFDSNNMIRMVSRPAIQQFKTIDIYAKDAPSDCFSTKFAWYCSWFFDKDMDIKIKNSNDQDYPFYIPEEIIINFSKIYPENKNILEPVWIPFFVKKDSKFIKADYGKIEKHTSAYDMEIL